MKKSWLIAILGLAIPAASSFGQGSMAFNSYTAGPSSTGVQIFFDYNGTITPLGAGWTADLVYSMTAISDPAGSGVLNPGFMLASSAAPSIRSVTTPFDAAHPGYFQGLNNFSINPYTAGTPVYFEVIAYQPSGGSYATAMDRGHSAAFSYVLATGLTTPTMPGGWGFTVYSIPEPSTLALTGLGGLASLIALRRKPVK